MNIFTEDELKPTFIIRILSQKTFRYSPLAQTFKNKKKQLRMLEENKLMLFESL